MYYEESITFAQIIDNDSNLIVNIPTCESLYAWSVE